MRPIAFTSKRVSHFENKIPSRAEKFDWLSRPFVNIPFYSYSFSFLTQSSRLYNERYSPLSLQLTSSLYVFRILRD